MPKNPPFTPELRTQMADVVAEGVGNYVFEFTSRLFPDHTAKDAQDCIVEGLARGIAMYESTTHKSISKALAMALLDQHKD